MIQIDSVPGSVDVYHIVYVCHHLHDSVDIAQRFFVGRLLFVPLSEHELDA